MSRRCAVNGCTSNERTNTGLAFYNLPTNGVLREKWIIISGVSKGLICSKHFEKKCFAGNWKNKKRRIFPGSIPSIFNDNVSTVALEKIKCNTMMGASSMLDDETIIETIPDTEMMNNDPNIKTVSSATMKDKLSMMVDELNNESVPNSVSSVQELKQARQIESQIYVDLNQNEIQNTNQDMNKKLFDEKIDTEMNKLHKKLIARSLELKKRVEKYFSDFDDKNEKMMKNLNEKVQYNRDLTEAILKHDKKSEIVSLSKPVLNELKRTQQLCTVVYNEMSRYPPEIQFTYDETFEKCVSSIRAIGIDTVNTTLPTDLDLSENNSDEPSSRD